MALVTQATDVSVDAVNAMRAPVLAGSLYAGEALLAGAPCYVKNSDGKVYMSNGTAATEPSKMHGFTARATAINEPVTLFGPGTRMRYAASGLTPGNRLYIGTTAGRLDTAATTGDAVGVAYAVSATDIVVGNYKLA